MHLSVWDDRRIPSGRKGGMIGRKFGSPWLAKVFRLIGKWHISDSIKTYDRSYQSRCRIGSLQSLFQIFSIIILWEELTMGTGYIGQQWEAIVAWTSVEAQMKKRNSHDVYPSTDSLRTEDLAQNLYLARLHTLLQLPLPYRYTTLTLYSSVKRETVPSFHRPRTCT